MDSTNKVDPRAICDRYTDDIYAKMRDDGERTSAYARAIAAAAPGKVCLDVGTGALALLALLAAKAGAKHVYAVEANAEAAEAARATVAAVLPALVTSDAFAPACISSKTQLAFPS